MKKLTNVKVAKVLEGGEVEHHFKVGSEVKVIADGFLIMGFLPDDSVVKCWGYNVKSNIYDTQILQKEQIEILRDAELPKVAIDDDYWKDEGTGVIAELVSPYSEFAGTAEEEAEYLEEVNEGLMEQGTMPIESFDELAVVSFFNPFINRLKMIRIPEEYLTIEEVV